MSELKRVAPQTLEFSGSLNNDTKKEKKGGDKEKGKNIPTFRFELIIDHTNDKGYTEFNYSHLLKSAEKKRSKESKCVEENAVNGLDPFNDDDDDKLREMAKRLEAKYGTTTSIGKNRKNHGDDVDLGAGYDENDSFIDNTDAYDEVVPEGVTTALGGFYINSGPLEFSVKAAERNSLSNQNHNNNNDDDSSESSEDDVENSNGPSSRRRSRGISSSSDDDTEEHSEEPVAKKSKLEENGDKKSNHHDVKKRKKMINDVDKNSNDKQQNQMEIDITTPGTTDNDDEKKLKTSDIRRHKDKKFDIKKFVKNPHANGIDDNKKLDVKKLGGKDSSIDDAIESVVNDGKMEDESSRDTLDSGKSRCIAGTSSECEDGDKSDCPLPDNLSEKTKEIIENLKKEIKSAKERKSKHAKSLISNILISLEIRMREKESSTVRSQVYAHLAPFFPCSKLTLVNRAKKLCVSRTEDLVKEPLNRLKALIEEAMPSAVERYNKECQRLAEEKVLDQSPSDADSSEVDDKPASEKSKIPRRRFSWSSESRKLVCEIAKAWRDHYKIHKPRNESMEKFVASYMESNVLPLWPAGWMKLNILMKYSENEPAKRKQKKQRDQSNSNTIPSSTVTNSSLVLDVNSVSQERLKSPTNFIKNTIDNPVNYSITSPSRKLTTTDIVIERNKHSVSKHKDTTGASLQDGSLPAKISVVPTSQLMAQKPSKSSSSHSDKFNPMDLTSSSLSITPVNDYQKSSKTLSDVKKDVVSITPYSELNTVSDASHSSNRPETMSSSSSYSMSNQSTKPVSLKQRILQDSSSIDGKGEKKIDERDLIAEQIHHKTEHKDKKRERWQDDKHRSHELKKRKKEQQLINQDVGGGGGSTSQQLTKDEQEQRQIEETEAATNFLSQIINDDLPRSTNDKRKDTNLIDESINNMIQASEEEKNAHEVMKKLKELQELTEMKYSPSHSPFQKPKSSNQYVGYSDDYHRIYHKKDDKLRLSKDDQW